MNQFNTLLKVKTYEEITQIEELDKVNNEIYMVRERIDSLTNKIDLYKMELNGKINPFEQISSRAIINSITLDLENEKRRLLELNNKRESIFNILSNIRKEIKSVEILIEKKKEELRIQELYREQELLDELNTLEC